MNVPRIVIAGTHSGAGKTTIATGIMAALRLRGLRVQAFKIGPDFIDPTFHRVATGRPSRNLDGWMLSRETNLEIFARATADADVAVVEGVMGMFDGKDGRSLSGTTAEMAIWLDAAVVLVLDASALAGSAAALVHGFDTLVPEMRVTAVIANFVAGAGHYDYLRDAIGARCRAEAIGYLPRESALAFPERHLGLHMAAETLTPETLSKLAGRIEEHIDLDRLLELSNRPPMTATPRPTAAENGPAIAIARDAAFCFYYEDNLDLLRQCGARLVEFSPLADRSLPPNIHGIYFGGGYPELHAEALAANIRMRHQVAGFVAQDGPVYAECGGFMYLTESIIDLAGREWPMAGVFPTKARMQERLARLGYVEVETAAGKARGHEYRYSITDPMPESVARRGSGYQVRGAFGSYVHLHFLSCPPNAQGIRGGVAKTFIEECERWRSER